MILPKLAGDYYRVMIDRPAKPFGQDSSPLKKQKTNK